MCRAFYRRPPSPYNMRIYHRRERLPGLSTHALQFTLPLALALPRVAAWTCPFSTRCRMTTPPLPAWTIIALATGLLTLCYRHPLAGTQHHHATGCHVHNACFRLLRRTGGKQGGTSSLQLHAARATGLLRASTWNYSHTRCLPSLWHTCFMRPTPPCQDLLYIRR